MGGGRVYEYYLEAHNESRGHMPSLDYSVCWISVISTNSIPLKDFQSTVSFL